MSTQKLPPHFTSPNALSTKQNHPERLLCAPQTARHLLPSFLSSSLLLSHSFSSSSSLPLTHARSLSLSLTFSLPLSLCLSFSPLSPRPVCMNNVLPFVMRARGEKNTLECSPAPRSDIENEWQLTWMPIFIRLTPGWQHSLYSPTQAVTSAISDPSHHLPPPLSLPIPLAAEHTPPRFLFHWRYSVPYRTPRALHAHLRFISGGARWPPIGIKRDLHSAAGRLGCSPRRKAEETYLFVPQETRKNCHLVKSQMYV